MNHLLVPKLERDIGIEVYATEIEGLGGVIREDVEDFLVEELLADGSKAKITPQEGHGERQVLGSSQTRNEYMLCVLVKRNWDTFIAVRNVAKQLGLPADRIGFAGIKDAKAVTAQHITIKGASIEDLHGFGVKDIELRPVGYLRRALSSFYLLGNSFRITISQMDHDEAAMRERVAETIQQLTRMGGVPNFYGHQRFGTTRPITHLVGKAIVKGNLEQAAMLFLAEPFPDEHPDSQQARRQLQDTRDFKKALAEFPRQLRYERLMLRRLVERPDDFVGAFRMLPTRLRELFVQAYQSYIFNKSLSRRIGDGFPLNAARVGDYVVGVERSGLPAVDMFKTATAENVSGINEAIEAGKMRLALPLVGYRQRPSQGTQGEIERRILEQESTKPEDLKTETLPEASGRGELRAATTPLNNFSLDKITECQSNPSKNEATTSFTLLRGSYATLVLREIMKPQNPAQAGF